MQLLIVEDDEFLRKHWTDLLQTEGWTVRCAGSRDEAKQQVHVAPDPDVILLDLGLPPEPGTPEIGFELLQHILLELPRVKLVVLTGQDEPSICWQAIGLGAFDYLVKPASKSSVLQSLQRARLFADAEHHLVQRGQVRLTVTGPMSEGVREFGEAAQERLVRSVLADCANNVAQAARKLGLGRENLYYFIRKFGIDRET